MRALATTVVLAVAGAVAACGSDDGRSSGVGGAAGAAGTAGAAGSGTTVGVRITGVDITQGVRRRLNHQGRPITDGVPIVGGRPALMRLYYESLSAGETVTAELRLGDGAPITASHERVLQSDVSDLSTTLNFDVPEDRLSAGDLDFAITLSDEAGEELGRHPSGGTDTLAVAGDGRVLELVLVPIQYDFDGSGRVATVDEAVRQKFRDVLWTRYPLADVDVRVTDVLPYSAAVETNGGGWTDVLQAVGAVRAMESPTESSVHVGLVQPTDTIQQFCGMGCTRSLSAPGLSASTQFGVQIHYADSEIGSTPLTVGVTQGLLSAPCGGVSSPDPDFPHSAARIGEWGYDLVSGELYDPVTYRDFMSLCTPTWISDYHYTKLYERFEGILGG